MSKKNIKDPMDSERTLTKTNVARIVRLTLPAGVLLLVALTGAVDITLRHSELTAHRNTLMSVVILTTIAWLLVFALLLSTVFLRQIVRPIEMLARKLRRVNPQEPAKSTFPVPPALAHNEIGQVMRATNQLLKNLDDSLTAGKAQAKDAENREKFLSQILDNVAEGIVCLGTDLKIVRSNKAACTLMERDAHALNGMDFTSALAIGDRQRFLSRTNLLGKAQPQDKAEELDAELICASGAKSITITMTHLHGDAGRGFIIVFRDISESKRAQSQIRENEQRLTLAVRATRCGVWDHHLETDNFWWSPEFLSMLGYNPDEIKASQQAKFDLIHPEDINWVMTSSQRYLAREATDYNPEYRMKHKDGSWIWMEDRGTAEWKEDGTPIRFSGTMIDCTERKRFEKQMMYMATHDPLTDLPNRTLLNDRIEHALVGNQRIGLMVAVLLLDIDRFKLINDSLGHEVGDQLIRSVAERLQKNIRPTDTLARMSGDEFVVICEDLPTPQEGARVAKRLLNAMAGHFLVDGQQLNIGMSIGISVSPSDGTNSQDILRHADTAMHSAKAAGGNCYRFFVADMNKEAVQRLTLERQISEGIERQQFMLHYQPKVDIRSGTIIGAEALIRWPHMRRGMINPAQFITVAEETGQILAIGDWVLREAIAQIACWLDKGYEPVPVAINLSAKQLVQEGLDEHILRLLKEYEVPHHLIQLEITESAVMTKMDRVLPILSRLRSEGIGISLDDFGTGYSSLAYLRQLPITELKVDRSFVNDVPGKEDACSIASIIIQIGHTLGLKVVAEGIETKEQNDFLIEKGCDIGQGWLFYRPLSPSRFTQKLVKKISQPA